MIIGVAAAEIAVKSCIATLVPDAEWLAMNVPSPPLVRMLDEYLPTLTTKAMVDGATPRAPSRLIGTLKKAVLLRNTVTHTGKQEIRTETATEALLAVWDVLWLCDFYAGHEWAAKFIGIATKRELGLPTDADYRWLNVDD